MRPLGRTDVLVRGAVPAVPAAPEALLVLLATEDAALVEDIEALVAIEEAFDADIVAEETDLVALAALEAARRPVCSAKRFSMLWCVCSVERALYLYICLCPCAGLF